MNITLSVLNVAALVALVTFHFSGNSDEAAQVAARQQPHHLLRQAPQLAVMTDKGQTSAILTNEAGAGRQVIAGDSQRWVF